MTAAGLPKRSMPVGRVPAQESIADAAALTETELPLSAGGFPTVRSQYLPCHGSEPAEVLGIVRCLCQPLKGVSVVSPRSPAVCLVSKFGSSCSGTLVLASSAASVRALRGSRSQFRQGSRRWLLSGDGHGDPLGTYLKNFSSPAFPMSFRQFILRTRTRVPLSSFPGV